MSAAREFCKLWFWSLLSFIFCIISIGLAIALIVVTAHRDSLQGRLITTPAPLNQTAKTIMCGSVTTNDIDLTEPASPGPFHDLTKLEIKKLREFLENHEEIKAAKTEIFSLNTSYIFMMDLWLPKKKDVLNFLSGYTGEVSRSARVIMFRGDKNPPVVEELKCGPLPNVFSCQLLKESETSTRNPMEFSFRPYTHQELNAEGTMNDLLKSLDVQIGTVLEEIFKSKFLDCIKSNDCLTYSIIPVVHELINDSSSSSREFWLFPRYNVPYYYLHPLGMSILCQTDGVDSSKWTFSKIWYAGKIFNNVTHFVDAFNNNNVKKIKMTKPFESSNLFSTIHLRGDPQPSIPQRPPTVIEPDGKRYTLKNRKITYMNWEFNFRMSTLNGPALYDVRFKGERIAYTLALSEIAVVYPDIFPWQSSQYIDVGLKVGLQSRALVIGGDCPVSATLINQTYFNSNGNLSSTSYVTFCVFEHNNWIPLRRYPSPTVNQGQFYSEHFESSLILRTALTLLNYDYIIDFIFHRNGVLETNVMTTGYISANFYSDLEENHGFRLGENIAGSINQHLFHFKVDLDINGTSNRYQTLSLETHQVNETSEPGQVFYQNKLVRTTKTSELDALYSFNFVKPKQHIVFNNSTNRGYRIQLDGTSTTLLSKDLNNNKKVPWALHQMAVTKHKDSETLSSSLYALLDNFRPATDFTTYYTDNESIVDEDLVLWITCGTHHIPHTEDLPVTSTIGNTVGFYLLPFNYDEEYHDDNQPKGPQETSQAYYSELNNPKKEATIKRHTITQSECLLEKSSLEADVLSHPEYFLQMNIKNKTN